MATVQKRRGGMACDPRLTSTGWEVNHGPAIAQTTPRDSLQEIVQDLPLERIQGVARGESLQWLAFLCVLGGAPVVEPWFDCRD